MLHWCGGRSLSCGEGSRILLANLCSRSPRSPCPTVAGHHDRSSVDIAQEVGSASACLPAARPSAATPKTHNIFPGHINTKGAGRCCHDRRQTRGAHAQGTFQADHGLMRRLARARAMGASSPWPCCSPHFVLDERQAEANRARRGGGLPPGPSPRGGGRSRARQGAVRSGGGQEARFPLTASAALERYAGCGELRVQATPCLCKAVKLTDSARLNDGN